jgi:DNA helicase-2/ATP-dependent DNA helicase PcrA
MHTTDTLAFMQRATGMVYSDEQARLIASDGGACVLACAGSGKTTAMTHMIARRLLDKSLTSARRILGVTFSRTGAAEMDERLKTLLGSLDIDADVKMKTLHAFCLEFLKDIGAMRGRAVLGEYEKLNILRELGRKHTKGFKYEDADEIAGLMTLQRGSMRPREEFVTSLDFRSSGIDVLKYTTLYNELIKYKSENNLIDFDDMLLLAHYKLGQSPFYGERFMQRYECVMVDEAQDMSVLQYRIVFQLLGKDAVDAREHDEHVRKALVLIGDDDQCIYQWMGSDPDSLSKAMDAYRLPLYMLSTNYRCPENVLSAAARCIAHNARSVPKSMNAYKSGGKMIYLRVHGGFAPESKYIADRIQDALDAGESPDSIAVLARNGVHVSLVWLYLTCYGIKSRLFGGQSSGSGDLLRHIIRCFQIHTSTADAGNVLYALLGGSRAKANKISEIINQIDGTFHEWCEYVLSEYVPKLGIRASDDNSYVNAGRLWKESMREFYISGGLAGAPIECMNLLYAAGEGSPADFYAAVLVVYQRNMSWKYRERDHERIFIGTIQALQQLISTDAERVLPMLESLDKHKAPNKNYITLSTAHSAKGREWDTVYILCDDSLAFPAGISLQLMRRFGGERAVERFIESERRLHYVAMTRAKRALCVVGGDEQPGGFLREALLDDCDTQVVERVV